SRLGRIFFSEASENPFLSGSLIDADARLSEETAREIDLEVRQIVEDSLSEVRLILQARRAALEALARRLVEKEVIDGNEVRTLLETYYPGPKLVPGSQAVAAAKEEARDVKSEEGEMLASQPVRHL